MLEFISKLIFFIIVFAGAFWTLLFVFGIFAMFYIVFFFLTGSVLLYLDLFQSSTLHWMLATIVINAIVTTIIAYLARDDFKHDNIGLLRYIIRKGKKGFFE